MSDVVLARVRKLLAFAIMVVVCVGCIIYGNHAAAVDADMLYADAEQLQELKAELDAAKAERASTVRDVSGRVTGVDYGRVDRDVRLGEDIASLIGTWDSLEAYQSQRVALSERYGISEDNALLSSLMPYVEADERSGYDIITAEGLNGRISAVTTWLVSMEGDTYRYLTDATMLTTSGTNGATSEFLIMYSTDRSGAVSDTFGTKLS